MFQYAKELKFEEAAKTRDKIEEMRSALVRV
ncbi:MAG: UvrB/UvrC motif-containing protein [Pseudomonadota bacterium]|nr:UvrB/UvrC motif-containing protein [Pseudomonadota bacterium]